MTFRATNIIPQRGYELAKARATKLRSWSQQMSAMCNTDLPAQQLIAILSGLSGHKNELEIAKNTNGIVAYAKDQENDPAYDVAAEFIAVLVLIDDAIAVVQATNTNVLINDWTLTGISWNSFTPAQTATLKSALDDIVAAIS